MTHVRLLSAAVFELAETWRLQAAAMAVDEAKIAASPLWLCDHADDLHGFISHSR